MKKKISILVQMDPLECLNIKTDTTCCLIIEALNRGYNVMSCEPKDIYLNDFEVSANATTLDLDKNFIIKRGNKKNVPQSIFDFVLIRQDPPFDMNYVTNMYLNNYNLGNKKKPFFINNPRGLLNLTEKVYPLFFKEYTPHTSISCNKSLINKFIKKYERVVIKPLFLKGGEDIFMITKNDPNTSAILEYMTKNFKTPIVIQEFIEEVRNGDKRVILIDGEAVGCINRIPLEGDFRANLHLGGYGEKTELTHKEKKICKNIKNSLKKNGFFFVGIDIINEKLTEINVTSPTGIVQINEINNTILEDIFWDKAIEKI